MVAEPAYVPRDSKRGGEACLGIRVRIRARVRARIRDTTVRLVG